MAPLVRFRPCSETGDVGRISGGTGVPLPGGLPVANGTAADEDA